MDINKETRKAINIIKFRKQYPTARDILDAYSLPEYLLQWHADFSSRGWKEISKERAERKFGHEITDEEFDKEFKEDHDEYLRKLDEHALDLVAPEDTQISIRRRPDKLREILKDGRVKLMFETQTVGGELLIGSKRQAEVEEALYGFPLHYPGELRPLYTSVTKGSYVNEEVHMYGSAVIKLKSSVKQRATKTMYDSAAFVSPILKISRFITGRPVPFNEPGRNCFPLADPLPNWREDLMPEEKITIATTPHKKDPLEFKTANDIKPWLEGQIHGGLTIDDIERIDFSESMDFELKREIDKQLSNSQEAYLRRLLNDAGKHEVEKIVEEIRKKGLTAVIESILREPINDQIRIKLDKIYSKRLESLKQSAEEQKKDLKKLLEKRGIAYSFYGDSTE